jgi:hypothetical protein
LIPTTAARQYLTILVITVSFCYSRNWWQHMYSGQYYILFAFVFAVTAYLYTKKKIAVLLMFTLAVLVRPFFLFASIPFIFKNWKRDIRWLILGGFISLVLVFVSGSYKEFGRYSEAMKLYGSEITRWQAGEDMNVQRSVPASMEACVFKQTSRAPFGAGCLFSVQHYLKLFNINISNPNVYSALLVCFIALLIVVTSYKQIAASPENIILTSFLIYVICELFAPANRNPYNMVQYLGIAGVFFNKARFGVILLFITGLALNHDFPFRFAYQRELGELLLLLAVYFVIMEGRFSKRRTLNKVN